ncbi:AraC family transcriptional regulator [Dyadobacter chenwenxiniae]|uniref:AraC family transcriptional regulator n=1 Tax=Dyadobacter chenwenxiniae TaxID=2906456 RepID=A0A9X1PKF0_9BACT|nr:helix-turn-helix domain-containing protein [Dyadobacter chenwenxiniae]MCF0060411.1 AraC family transcriptional regulator [Dyadobacter chenwenxiniae]UON86142.1 AraC family transcriptional regulator [Dyadobacter chenwenxiniae]
MRLKGNNIGNRGKISRIPEYGLAEPGSKGIVVRRLSPDTRVTGSHSVALPHRDKHYMLLIIEEGKLTGSIDLEKLDLEGPFVLLVFPGQIHLLTQVSPLKGWVIDFDPTVIDQSQQNELDIYFQRPVKIDQLPTDAGYRQIEKLLTVIAEQSLQRGLAGKAMVALFSGMLYILSSIASSVAEQSKHKKNRPQLIKQQFLALLAEHYRDWKKPSQYAQELSISTAHLNDMLKQLTGSTATTIIQDHCMLEAQRLLRYTDISIKEISYQIGYTNPSHFIAIFSARLRTTPLQYRIKYANSR